MIVKLLVLTPIVGFSQYSCEDYDSLIIAKAYRLIEATDSLEDRRSIAGISKLEVQFVSFHHEPRGLWADTGTDYVGETSTAHVLAGNWNFASIFDSLIDMALKGKFRIFDGAMTKELDIADFRDLLRPKYVGCDGDSQSADTRLSWFLYSTRVISDIAVVSQWNFSANRRITSRVVAVAPVHMCRSIWTGDFCGFHALFWLLLDSK